MYLHIHHSYFIGCTFLLFFVNQTILFTKIGAKADFVNTLIFNKVVLLLFRIHRYLNCCICEEIWKNE